jgi:hypothetical protein
VKKGAHPNSRAALKDVNAERARKKNARRPHLAAFHGPEHMAKMTEARRRKAAIAREFPIVVEKNKEIRHEPRTHAHILPTEPAGPAPHERVAADGGLAAVAPLPPPAGPPREVAAPVVVEETEGERRARLYARDYKLLFTKGGWRELNRLMGQETSTFPRVSSRLRMEAL